MWLTFLLSKPKTKAGKTTSSTGIWDNINDIKSLLKTSFISMWKAYSIINLIQFPVLYDRSKKFNCVSNCVYIFLQSCWRMWKSPNKKKWVRKYKMLYKEMFMVYYLEQTWTILTFNIIKKSRHGFNPNSWYNYTEM